MAETFTPTNTVASNKDTLSPIEVTAYNPTGDTSKRRDMEMYATYNQQAYSIELYLDSGGGVTDEQKFPINPASIVYMNIEDALLNWSSTGSISFMYASTGDLRDDKTGQTSDTPTLGETSVTALKNYVFRGDGYDVLRVKISLVSDSETIGGFDVPKDSPKWTLSYMFSVYDIEDVMNPPGADNTVANTVKCMKLYLKDLRQHILETTNLEYSTAENSSDDPRSTEYNNQGLLPTGTAMLEIVDSAFKQNPFNMDLGSLLRGNVWDEGASKIFYTSPAESSAYDDLMYISDQHVSQKQVGDVQDMALLTTIRASDGKSISDLALIPITDLFEKAGNVADTPGDNQVEHFFLNTFGGDEGNVTNSFKAPISKDGSSTKDVKTFKYGMITSFSFVDMAPDTNALEFRTTPVCSTDFSNRTFNVEFKDNTVESARQAIADSYISKLYTKGSGSSLFTTVLDKTKRDVNVFPSYSLHGDNKILRVNAGLHKLMYTGLFQNTCIYFTTLGLPLRNSGTFIAIDKTTGSADNDYNNKLFGQWLVLRVDHVFEGGLYYNNIYAVKVHRYSKLEREFINTI